MKRIFWLLALLTMLFTVAQAENGQAVHINSVADLQQLAKDVNGGDSKSGVTYLLEKDLDLSGINWTPIGEQYEDSGNLIQHPFSGVFDGQGHIITGLTVKGRYLESVGLFGYVEGKDATHTAQLRNIVLRDVNIEGHFAGALVGSYLSHTEPLENCQVFGSSVTGVQHAGGLVGCSEGEIRNCAASVGVAGATYSGGIAGESVAPVSRCYATGDVSGKWVGGVIGYARANIRECYATGNINGNISDGSSNAGAGGIAGATIGSGVEILNCYATGKVSSDQSGQSAGGIVGVELAGTLAITNCYTTGNSVEANNGPAGGIVGAVISGSASISHCAALNTLVEVKNGSYLGGRIIIYDLNAADNYAWDKMKLNYPGHNGTVNTDNANDKNGANLSYTSSGLSKQFADIFGSAVTGDAWTFTDNGLPILKNVGGTQSKTLPIWVTAQTNTIYISTEADLRWLAESVNNGTADTSGKTYILMNDITLRGEWTPIGTSTNPFKGVFNGNGYTLSGLTMTQNHDFAGLFGYLNDGAKVENLRIDNPNISGMGANIAGAAGALAGVSAGATVQNCAVTGGKITGNYGTIGGLVGSNANDKGVIRNCYATCDVSTENSAGTAGGIAGSSYGLIEKCLTTGRAITRSTTINRKMGGGIVGKNAGKVSNCVALGQEMSGGRISCIEGTAGAVTNSYAWLGMSHGNESKDQNGIDLSYDGSGWSRLLSEIFGFDTAWTYAENGLPVLNALRAPQSSAVPGWITASVPQYQVTLTAATGIDGFRYQIGAGSWVNYTAPFMVMLQSDLTIEPILVSNYSFDRWNDGTTNATYRVTVGNDLALTASAKWDESKRVQLPKTGDDSMLMLWGAVLAASAAALVSLRKKKA